MCQTAVRLDRHRLSVEVLSSRSVTYEGTFVLTKVVGWIQMAYEQSVALGFLVIHDDSSPAADGTVVARTDKRTSIDLR